MASAYGGHDGQSTHSIEPRADYTAVNTVKTVVAHQLRLHGDVRCHPLGRDAVYLEPQNLIEGNRLLEDALEGQNEFGFENYRRARGGRGYGFRHAGVSQPKLTSRPTLS